LQRKRKAELALSKPAKRGISRVPADDTTLRLQDLKDLYKIGATNSIPGSINDKVTEKLIRRSCSRWPEMLEQLLRDVSSLVRNIIAEAVDKAVGAWSHTQEYEETRNALLNHFNKTMTAESGAIKQNLSLQHRTLRCVAGRGSGPRATAQEACGQEGQIGAGCSTRREAAGLGVPVPLMGHNVLDLELADVEA
jgi:hypothetical protein